ncbi:MAG TPA: amylo-alpha-1,6-glucosidase [Bacteroidota bacterium]|nr:amylo-alpha-1,6-glucosidase [Bacteroidota bacterium]
MKYPYYRYATGSLFTGSSLGNSASFARLNEETNLLGLWSSSDNQYYLGEWHVEVVVDGNVLSPKETFFYPESQVTTYAVHSMEIEKRFFIPYHPNLESQNLQSQPDQLPERCAIFLLRLKGMAKGGPVIIRHRLVVPAVRTDKFTKQAPTGQMEKRVEIRKNQPWCEILTKGKQAEARVFGSLRRWKSCEESDATLTVEYEIPSGSAEDVEVPFIFTFSPNGIPEALETFHRVHGEKLHRDTIQQYAGILSRAELYTPDPAINRGLQWAKINTVRVQHRYRSGAAFTNDPPQDIVVVRDLAWYVFGSDYVTPEFSRELLLFAERAAFHPDGKLTEYIHADEPTPVLHDYNLNINDDTPLYVLALYHHALVCGDQLTPGYVFPFMKRACDYIISQIRDGLVRCYADGTNVWGSCSWRNIIDGYNLTGAVTEINAECYAALMRTAETARALNKNAEAEYYQEKAHALKNRINEVLVSEKTGLYLLNLDNNGVRHHDVTGDLIFPVFCEVAEERMREKILEKLTGGELWTQYGSHTVSKGDPSYDPDFGYQLMGGLWHNLTAWIGYCVRTRNPELLVQGMRNIYRLSETECPGDFHNVVPGEFPERLHGETFESRGMAMSPWMPPTYLWLGVEGLLGFSASLSGFDLRPSLPSDWNWIAVRNMLYNGRPISAFVYDRTLYSTEAVRSDLPTVIGVPVDSDCDAGEIFSIGMTVENELLLFAATDAGAQGTIIIHGLHIEQPVALNAGEARLFRIALKQHGVHKSQIASRS